MLFPGQGAQSVGMLDGLARDHPVVGDTLAEASEVLGYDVAELINRGPAATLDQTEYTQPAMLVADIAIYRAWHAAGGPRPGYVAGHSLGEYAALVVADALSFADALRLTSIRATAMARAVDDVEVAMSAVVGLDDDAVARACADASSAMARPDAVVAPANYNAPGQVVIAGHADAVEAAGEQARGLGARMIRPLAVSVPSHSALMRPAADVLIEALTTVDLNMPTISLLHNVDAAPRDDIDGLKRALSDQLWHPVHWAESVRRMRDAGIDTFLECGPGRVLAGLNKRIDKSMTTISLGGPDALRQAVVTAA